MKLILVGYMGSGKTYISRALSKSQGVSALDLDQYIEDKEGLTISEIFDTKGAFVFRQLERKYLLDLIKNEADLILSVGGGTPCFGDNIGVMNKFACTVYLKTPLDILYDRLKKEKEKRPLIANIKDSNLKEFIAKHLFERQQFYEKSSHIIDTTAKSTSAIVNEVVELCSFG